MSRKTWLAAALLAVGMGGNVAAAPVLYSGTGHYYDYVSGSFTQSAAIADAATQSFGGQQGYLATVTSQGEQDFLFGITNSLAWLGGQYSDNAWRWATGPETGQTFYGTPTPDIAYSYWNSGEPNGNAGEPALVANWNNNNGAWNDWSPGNQIGYYVEFNAPAGVPELASWAMMVLGFGVVGMAARNRKVRAYA